MCLRYSSSQLIAFVDIPLWWWLISILAASRDKRICDLYGIFTRNLVILDTTLEVKLGIQWVQINLCILGIASSISFVGSCENSQNVLRCETNNLYLHYAMC